MMVRRETPQSCCETACGAARPETYLNSTLRGTAASLPAEDSSEQEIRDRSRSVHELWGLERLTMTVGIRRLSSWPSVEIKQAENR